MCRTEAEQQKPQCWSSGRGASQCALGEAAHPLSAKNSRSTAGRGSSAARGGGSISGCSAIPEPKIFRRSVRQPLI